jgi:hypothetical protein
VNVSDERNQRSKVPPVTSTFVIREKNLSRNTIQKNERKREVTNELHSFTKKVIVIGLLDSLPASSSFVAPDINRKHLQKIEQ